MADTAQGAGAMAAPATLSLENDGQSGRAGAAQFDIPTGLSYLSFLVQGIFASVAERHDLTPVQARLLCTVAEGPRGMAELANCFGVEKAALTGLVDRAERRGLAERTPVPGDRRALRVTPTKAGYQVAAAFHADMAAELNRLVHGLSPHDREHLRRTLALIAAAHGELGHQPGPAQPERE